MSGRRPPGDEIAAYARENITCRNCGARPGFGCIDQAERWRTVCKGRFANAAAVYVPRGRTQPGGGGSARGHGRR
jgi:hypothetical protein